MHIERFKVKQSSRRRNIECHLCTGSNGIQHDDMSAMHEVLRSPDLSPDGVVI